MLPFFHFDMLLINLTSLNEMLKFPDTLEIKNWSVFLFCIIFLYNATITYLVFLQLLIYLHIIFITFSTLFYFYHFYP